MDYVDTEQSRWISFWAKFANSNCMCLYFRVVAYTIDGSARLQHIVAQIYRLRPSTFFIFNESILMPGTVRT